MQRFDEVAQEAGTDPTSWSASCYSPSAAFSCLASSSAFASIAWEM